MRPLEGTRVVTLAPNVPGPAAAARLQEFGATVVKVEAPAGDPLFHMRPAWYEALASGQEVVTLDLKARAEREKLSELLSGADLLLTSSRPAALGRLGLSWEALHEKYPRLSQVAIVGYPKPRENEPGHDLTYQAEWEMLAPPDLPRTLLADLAGAERAVSAALGLLLGRERGLGTGYVEVALSEAAEFFAQPLVYGMTVPGDMLGGGLPGYNLYRTSDAWIAIAALEPHFLEKLTAELGLEEPDQDSFAAKFSENPARWWEEWANERDLPLLALRKTDRRD